MENPVIATQSDYYVPLLRLLADYPDGQAQTQQAVDDFGERYRSCIAADHFEPLDSNPSEEKWSNYVRWARAKLNEVGFMEMPRRGVWKISDEGREWLEQNPTTWHLTPQTNKRGPRRTRRSAKTLKPAQEQTAPGISLEMLEQTKQMLGEEQFRQVWGALYDQLMIAERAKAITQVRERDILQVANQHIRQIQEYLQGRSSNRPSSEQLCDWIHFCYQFSLFREAAALYTLVNPDEVNSWYLERTRKIALTSRSRR